MSYYSQPAQNPGFQPQGGNPNYGWNQQAAGGPPPQAYTNQDPENGAKYDIKFNDETIRATFVRKVFTLVGIMLLLVAVMTAIPFLHPPMMSFVRQSPGFFYLGYATFFVTYLMLVCCESVRRSFPGNLILTAVFTLATGYMTAVITANYQIESVLMCALITGLSCGGVIIFAATMKKDLTSMMGIAAILGIFVMVFGFVAIIGVIVFHARWLYTLYAGIAALVFLFYLAIDIQMMMGGRKYEISPEDHIFAAVQIFVDVINIFWLVLALFGNNRN